MAQVLPPLIERWKISPLLWGRHSLGGILRDNLGEGNCDSNIAARQWGVNFCREASRCLTGLNAIRIVRFYIIAIRRQFDPLTCAKLWGSVGLFSQKFLRKRILLPPRVLFLKATLR